MNDEHLSPVPGRQLQHSDSARSATTIGIAMSKTAAKQAIESISNSSSTATTSIIPALVEDHSDSSSVSSSTDDEDDDDDDDDEDDEDEEDEEEVELRRKMQALLQKAKLSARAKAAAVKVDELKDQTEIVLFGDEGADSDDEGTRYAAASHLLTWKNA